MKDLSIDEIMSRVAEIAPGLHTAGTFAVKVLESIVKHVRKRPAIRHSAETGSGASTLLLSHLSEEHTIFAMDNGSGSVVNVRQSSLLREKAVTFVEGPTQKTLQKHPFHEKLQVVLIDGPHAYPFPELEYYFLYPHLDFGGLLILDDIHIPTVQNLFQFLKRDAMFELDEVVHTTAFFTRTDVPVFNPFGDQWWEQNYNRRLLLRYVWKEKLKGLVPMQVRLKLSYLRSRVSAGARQYPLSIVSPRSGERVGCTGEVEGRATIPEGCNLWLLVRRKGIDGWWPQGGGPVLISEGRWSVPVTYGGPQDLNCDFEIAALIVREATNQLWLDWLIRVEKDSLTPPVRLPHPDFLLGKSYRTVTRQ